MQKLGYLGGKKLGWPILSPPWLVTASTLPCHEYANNLCFSGGGEKLGRPILFPPRQDKASTLCRWLSGWRKTRLVRYFPTPTSESINLTLSWIHIQPLLIRGWRKTGPAHSFPPWLVKVSILCRCLSGWRKTRLVHYFPTLTSESINLTLSWICKQPLLFRGWGKTGPAYSFPTLTSVNINLVQKQGYLGGEKLGWPILSPPRLVKVWTLPRHEYANNLCFLGGGEKLGRPILSPPWQDKAWTTCRWLSGWRRTRLVHYFPTLTSESITLTLSWIHIPILLFRGWGKNGPAQFFPTL